MIVNELSEDEMRKQNRHRTALSRCIAKSKTNKPGGSAGRKWIYDPVKVYLPTIKLN